MPSSCISVGKETKKDRGREGQQLRKAQGRKSVQHFDLACCLNYPGEKKKEVSF